MSFQTKSSISVWTPEGGDVFFDLLSPEGFDFRIETVAHALSHLCRYTGHVNRFYSVAEHSVMVSLLVPHHLALEGLLHDASEAFLGDVSSPLKALLPDYKAIEYRVEQALATHFGLEFPYPQQIKDADKRAYLQERQEIAPCRDTLWHTEYRAARKTKAVGLTPEEAARLFMVRYEEVSRDRHGPVRRQTEAEGSAQEQVRQRVRAAAI